MAVTVKQVAARADLPSRTVRYHDRIGLVRGDERSTSGYRLYGPEGEGRLRFIRHAKSPGFSLDEIRGLLAAAAGGCGATVPELERPLDQKVAEIDVKIAEFVAFREQLAPSTAREGARTTRAAAATARSAHASMMFPTPRLRNER